MMFFLRYLMIMGPDKQVCPLFFFFFLVFWAHIDRIQNKNKNMANLCNQGIFPTFIPVIKPLD